MDEIINSFLSKAMHFCSTKEVCVFDMTKKLRAWGILDSKIDIIINELKTEKFIDEQRYALAFALDKFKFNNWGKRKIQFELKKKNVPEKFILLALNEINSEEYYLKAEKLFVSKLKTIKDINDLKERQKIFFYMNNKGFESELIFRIARKITSQ